MFFKLRRVLVLTAALLVMAMCLQSAADTPHDTKPADATTTTLAELALDIDGHDDPSAPPPAESAGGLQHEHSASVDHALIAPEGIDACRMDCDRIYVAAPTAAILSGRTIRTPDRPPRSLVRTPAARA